MPLSSQKAILCSKKLTRQIAELIRRGWTHADISGFAGGNLLRVMRGAERVADSMRKKAPSMVIYDKRRDLDPKELPYP